MMYKCTGDSLGQEVAWKFIFVAAPAHFAALHYEIIQYLVQTFQNIDRLYGHVDPQI